MNFIINNIFRYHLSSLKDRTEKITVITREDLHDYENDKKRKRTFLYDVENRQETDKKALPNH